MVTLYNACRAEWGRIISTPVDLALLTVMPLILLGAMAAMLSAGSPHHLPTVIVDRDGGVLARRIVRAIDASPGLRIVGRVPDVAAAVTMMRREQAVAAVVIPRGVGTRNAGRAPVEIFHQAAFLSTGALAATNLRVAVAATLAQYGASTHGLAGLAAIDPALLPGVQVTVLGNPSLSLEWYLGLLLGPGVLHLLIAVACVGSIGVLMNDGSFAAFAVRGGVAATLAGRLSPHVIAGTFWGVAWLLWLTLAQGYRADGSLLLIVAGQALLFVATAAIALLLVAATRSIATALSGAVIVAGSALAYSGASLPIDGAGLFARVWHQVLPLTHYMTLQMDQVLGASAGPFLKAAGTLLLYPLVAGGLGIILIRRDREGR